ncbi:MAG: ribonuclease HII [Clostridia bacterium]|nr:ribonuclease HII [Clostridia bacterium]
MTRRSTSASETKRRPGSRKKKERPERQITGAGKMPKDEQADLLRFEKMLKEKGVVFVAGVDEAGRGPLAGPVVAACAVFDMNKPFPEANDSKKLTEKQREKMFDGIIESCAAYGVGMADNERIDEINILRATYEAMRAAVNEAARKLGGYPEHILVDHVHIPDLPAGVEQISITHGDALSLSIGAASIIAKVTRDRLMTEMDSVYPGYGFAKHKGYGTAAHYQAIRELGMSPIHRRSFLKTLH